MRKRGVIFVLVVVALGATLIYAQSNGKLRGVLTGLEEVPVVYTSGGGTFRALISKDETSISYELSYSDMQSNVTQAHIHLGKANTNGGIQVWLCSNLPSPPTPVPPPVIPVCPQRAGTVTGVITGDSIVGPASQGIVKGELGELIRAMRDGNTYVNVHTEVSPGGEIRSQIGTDNNKGKGHH